MKTSTNNFFEIITGLTEGASKLLDDILTTYITNYLKNGVTTSKIFILLSTYMKDHKIKDQKEAIEQLVRELEELNCAKISFHKQNDDSRYEFTQILTSGKVFINGNLMVDLAPAVCNPLDAMILNDIPI